MLKTFNINLGGQAFIINEDAFHILDNYLNAIKRFYANEDGKDEIVQDIESRFAELFLQNDKDKIITDVDVNKVISIMGYPEDFNEEKIEFSSNYSNNSTKTDKRLYRDMDEKFIAGVCSGLSNYLGIKDPIWLRLFFVVSPFFTAGTAILIYIIFWIVMPEAKTTTEKMAMKGEKINLSNIVEKKNQIIESDVSSTLGNIIRTLVDIALKLAKGFFYFIVIVILGSILATFFAVLISLIFATPFAGKFIFTNTSDSIWLLVGNILLMSSLIIGLILLIVHLFSKTHKVFKLKTVLPLLVFFIAGLVLVIISSKNGLKNFRYNETITQSVPLSYTTIGDTLQLDISDKTRKDLNIQINSFNDFFAFLTQKYNIESDVEIEVLPTATDSFYVLKEFSSYGSTQKDALQNATSIVHTMNQYNNKLIIDPFFSYNTKDYKFRNQKLKLKVYVPDNKIIKWNDRTEEYINESKLPITWSEELAQKYALYLHSDDNDSVKLTVRVNGKNIDIDTNDIDDDNDNDDFYEREHYIFIMKDGKLIPLD